MRKTVILLAMLGATGFGLGVSGVQAQTPASSCATPGSVVLTGVATNRDEIGSSLKREIAGYGRAARVGGCKIHLKCIATDSGDPAREIARLQCVAVRDTLTQSGFTKEDIATARENPGSKTAGAVYFTVY